jgi:hypothetical protein
MTNMAHENEYRGAVDGMQETYGTGWSDTGNTLPAVGDFISGITKGKAWSGHVEWYSEDDGMVCVNVDHSWVRVPVSDITH